MSGLWESLREQQQRESRFCLADAFASQPDRFKEFSLLLEHAEGSLLVDFSKNLLSAETLRMLLALAEQCGVPKAMAGMLAGSRLNFSEERPALHYALRNVAGLLPDATGTAAQVQAELARVAAAAEQIRSGAWTGCTGKAIRTVINIGIGGSDLGPAMACAALAPYAAESLRLAFVSNVDGMHLAAALKDARPESTLFVLVSKTFTTQETLQNACDARRWLLAGLPAAGEAAAVARHFVAVSANAALAAAFGIQPAGVFSFWDWVGGRYSLWSAAGFTVCVAVGPAHFRQLLHGASHMDQHFFAAPLHRNIPAVLAVIGVWYNNFWGCQTQAVIPYEQGLAQLPAYLQQLEMESNGKRTGADGRPVAHQTAPVVWGQVGTNGQHAFFQAVHQGTKTIPLDFLAGMRSHEPAEISEHHRLLMANLLAQSEALMRGRSRAEVDAAGCSPALAPHREFPGNRPSTCILYDLLTPFTLGMLVAMYEHKVFVQGVIWGINSFDQWGVELGKQLAAVILEEIKAGAATKEHDASTAGLLAYYLAHK